MVGAADVASVIGTVRPERAIVPILYIAFIVTTMPLAGLLFVNVAVSCARGKFAKAGVPLDVVAHPVADQLAVPPKFQ